MVGQQLPQTNEKMLQRATVSDTIFSRTFSTDLNTSDIAYSTSGHETIYTHIMSTVVIGGSTAVFSLHVNFF